MKPELTPDQIEHTTLVEIWHQGPPKKEEEEKSDPRRDGPDCA